MATPVADDERVVQMDVIRGFALWGVCLANLEPWFSGYSFLSDDAKHKLATWPVDRVVDPFLTAFVHARFITIFSFLFGLGFSIQYLRAESRGARATWLLSRRLIAMLTLGLAHAFLVWYGDILNVYATVGIALLIARRWPVRRLVAWGVALAVFVPIAWTATFRIAPALAGTPTVVQRDSASRAPNASGTPNAPPQPAQTPAQRAIAAGDAHRDSVMTTQLPALVKQRSYRAILEANWLVFFQQFILNPNVWSFQLEIAGLFLLGLATGRSNVLRALDSHRDRWWTAFWWSAAVALAGYAPRLALQLFSVAPTKVPQDAVGMLRTLRMVGQPAMSMAYMCGLVLLFQLPAWRRRLMVLAPVGRMALTHYLTQSFIAVIVFYGIGFRMFGRVGPAVLVAMATVTIALQAMLGRWWLARYRFGPAEWLWRTMTYGRAQPMRVVR